MSRRLDVLVDNTSTAPNVNRARTLRPSGAARVLGATHCHPATAWNPRLGRLQDCPLRDRPG